tara:strand:+ start:3410 stop:3877 length:468 start_codon:yes stop_codon:yes gene_type:complete
MDLIQKKLYSDLKEHFKDYDKEDIDTIIKNKIDEKKSYINLKISSNNHYRDDKRNIDDSIRCQARLWNDHFEGRCKNKCKNDGLCLRHFNMLNENGYLEFGRITEQKPLRNKDGKILSWYEDVSGIEDHINLLREENKKRIIQYIIHHISKTENS